MKNKLRTLSNKENDRSTTRKFTTTKIAEPEYIQTLANKKVVVIGASKYWNEIFTSALNYSAYRPLRITTSGELTSFRKIELGDLKGFDIVVITSFLAYGMRIKIADLVAMAKSQNPAPYTIIFTEAPEEVLEYVNAQLIDLIIDKKNNRRKIANKVEKLVTETTPKSKECALTLDKDPDELTFPD
ncbi:MAG: hypothetical protein Q7S22_03170 [Candidatus Micrarchaeota archaeon]|nr:hypothetical protein [Candidatus Micrarchaeota archaeon]